MVNETVINYALWGPIVESTSLVLKLFGFFLFILFVIFFIKQRDKESGFCFFISLIFILYNTYLSLFYVDPRGPQLYIDSIFLDYFFIFPIFFIIVDLVFFLKNFQKQRIFRKIYFYVGVIILFTVSRVILAPLLAPALSPRLSSILTPYHTYHINKFFNPNNVKVRSIK